MEGEIKAVDEKSYRWAGVDIEAAEHAVELIGDHVETTRRPEMIGGVGGFGSLFELDTTKYRNPVLVSGTDGVGTKLKLAQMMGSHGSVGIDLVAMCADDVVSCGAEPLFFQDYISTGKVVPALISEIVSGIANGCRKAGCSLTGGEIAEHPGVMAPDDYDLAGFCVGVVERDRIIDGREIAPGDTIIGIASSGLHSNGYSLARKLLFDEGGFSLDDRHGIFAGTLGEELLTPSFIYAKTVLSLAGAVSLKGVAHITGGGITDNLPRVLPEGTGASVVLGSWPVTNIFTFLQDVGDIDLFEMLSTFNMGIGMVLVVSRDEAERTMGIVSREGFRPFRIGEIVSGDRTVRYR